MHTETTKMERENQMQWEWLTLHKPKLMAVVGLAIYVWASWQPEGKDTLVWYRKEASRAGFLRVIPRELYYEVLTRNRLPANVVCRAGRMQTQTAETLGLSLVPSLLHLPRRWCDLWWVQDNRRHRLQHSQQQRVVACDVGLCCGFVGTRAFFIWLLQH